MTRTRLPSNTTLDLVRLESLMARSEGSPGIGIGLVDGPVSVAHPDLAGARIESVGGGGETCSHPSGIACAHGTFVAGILVARRDSPAPSICPGCTLLVRPIFAEAGAGAGLPSANPDDVGCAVIESVDAGARVVNLSAATVAPTTRSEETLRQALDYAARRGALVVAAAGNQASLGTSEITRHSAVIPVVGYDLQGRPVNHSNFGSSAGRRGLGAPGTEVLSLAAAGDPVPRAGTSFAAAFVSGALALLWSLFPSADAGTLRRAVLDGPRRGSVVPPLLDAEAAYGKLAGNCG